MAHHKSFHEIFRKMLRLSNFLISSNTKRQIELKPPAAIGGLVTTEATELTKAADNPFGANISKKRE